MPSYYNKNYKANFFEMMGIYLFLLNHPVTFTRFAFQYSMNKDEIERKFTEHINELEREIDEIESK